MNRSREIRRLTHRPARASIAAVGVLVLTIVSLTAAPAVAADVTVYSVTTPDYTLALATSGSDLYEVTVTNLSASAQTFGLGATTHTPDAVEDLWTLPWSALAAASQTQLDPGQSYTSIVPRWPGARLVFYRDIFGSHQAIGTYSIPGAFLPFIVTGTEPAVSIQWGDRLDVGSGLAARAGEIVHVSTSGLQGSSADIWLLDQTQATANFGSRGGFASPWNHDGGRYLGTASLISGALEADLSLPSDLAPGAYAVIAGDPVTDVWPAGPVVTFDTVQGTFVSDTNLTIEPGAPRSTTPVGTSVNVTPVDSYGNSPVQFTFDQVTVSGATTFTSSTAGPTPIGFTVGGTTATYYDLTTTAVFTGSVVVCFRYDTTGLVETDPAWLAFRLYHYTGGAWQDITNPTPPAPAFGTLCGTTNSFSPFVIGTPTAPPVWPFTGFLDPVSSSSVNTEIAGSIIPVRFRVGQDRGLGILADGSPSSGLVPCGSTTEPSSPQPTVSALPNSLTYVKASNTYWYLWKTSTNWSGTCRNFTMKLADGSVHSASFKFVKLTFGGVLPKLLKLF